MFHRLEPSPGHHRAVCSILDHPLCVATPLFLIPRHLIDPHLPPGAGTVQLVEAGLPHRNYFSGTAHKLGVLYTTSVIMLEVITTTLIAARILQLGRWNRLAAASALPHNKMSRKAAAYPYTGAVAIIVESALPSTLSGVAYLVSYALGSDLSILFLSIYVMLSVRSKPVETFGGGTGGLTCHHASLQCISPQLIILRVVCGRAWTLRTTETLLSGESIDRARQVAIFSSAFSVDVGSTSSQICQDGGPYSSHSEVAVV